MSQSLMHEDFESAGQLSGLVSLPRVLLPPTAIFSFNMDRDKRHERRRQSHQEGGCPRPLVSSHHVGFDSKPLPPGAVYPIGLRTYGVSQLPRKATNKSVSVYWMSVFP